MSSDEAAAKAGDLQELKRLRRLHDHKEKLHVATFSRYMTLESLKYAHENGCPWNERTCEVAAEAGHLECLKYAHENGCPWDERACFEAAQYGHLDCLKYLHENGCTWDERTCGVAAYGGYLECLQYAHENGCPWFEGTCVEAAAGLELDCLQYLHENGCPWNIDQILNGLPNVDDINEGRVPLRRDIEAYVKDCMESPNKCPYHTAMVTLDEVKNAMKDGDYKTIADALMHAYRAKRRRE